MYVYTYMVTPLMIYLEAFYMYIFYNIYIYIKRGSG